MSGIVGGINSRSGLVNLGSSADGEVYTGTGAGLPVGFEEAAGGGAWELINSQTITSTPVYIDQTGLDTTTHQMWAIALQDILSDNASSQIYFAIGDSGGMDTGASDYGFHRMTSEDESSGDTRIYDENEAYIEICQSTDTSGYGISGLYHIATAGSTFQIKVWGAGVITNGGNVMQVANTWGRRKAAGVTMDRMRLGVNSGTLVSKK